MEIEPKVCPSCKERNNPTFSCCWKCGVALAGIQAVQLMTQVSEKTTSKKPIPFYWFFVGAFGFQCAVAFFRDFVTTQRYVEFGEMVSDVIPAMFGLTMMALINGGVFYGIYLIVRKANKKK